MKNLKDTSLICLLSCIFFISSCQNVTKRKTISLPNNIDYNRYKVLNGKTDTLQYAYLLSRLNEQFEQRRALVKNSLSSKTKLLERIEGMQQWYKEKIGELPPKTPLNPIVTGKIEMEAYTIEKVLFESQPNHHVTGLFYLPKKGKAPFPAVFIPCGHSRNGKAAESYQKAARLFALNGFAVLQADPISQGERFQYVDAQGMPKNNGGTRMHELLGQALLLTGSNTLIHELTDNIRCLDFLEQHPFVDKDRLAVAGNSGGGTQTTYLTAYDERVKVATPSCYIATTEKKFNTIGSQDGCQQLWAEGEAGIEEQDFLVMAAPKPIRMLVAEQDFFHIDGAKTAFYELKKQYALLGSPEKIDMVTADARHGWHKKLREASVQWCKQWLMNDKRPISEPADIGWIEADSLIWVSPKGQVMNAFAEEKTVIDLNKERLKACAKNRAQFLENHSPDEIRKQIKTLLGYETPKGWTVNITETWQENNFVFKKLLFKREKNSDFQIPALLFLPKKLKGKRPAIIMASEAGKNAELIPNGQIEVALNKGQIVLSIDLSNIGELKDGRKTHYANKEFWVAKLALYEGKTLMTYRVEDLIMAAQFMKNEDYVNGANIHLISDGLVAPAALHAGALSNLFKSVSTYNSIASWEDIARDYYTKNQLANIVPGVLNYYDLRDLVTIKQ